MIGTLFAFFSVGLLGSLHCIGMCGGFVAAYSLRGSPRTNLAAPGTNGAKSLGLVRGKGAGFLSHLAFNLGRMVTATALGALAGALGWGLGRGATAFGMQGAFALTFGALMIAIGLAQLGLLPIERLVVPVVRRMEGRMSTALGSAAQGARLAPVLVLGLLVEFLPCHLSYGALAMAAATGGILTGAVGMLLFILGTAPLLVAFGFGAREIGAVFRDRAVKISGIILVVMGVWTLYRTWPSAPPCCHHAARQEVISNQ